MTDLSMFIDGTRRESTSHGCIECAARQRASW